MKLVLLLCIFASSQLAFSDEALSYNCYFESGKKDIGDIYIVGDLILNEFETISVNGVWKRFISGTKDSSKIFLFEGEPGEDFDLEFKDRNYGLKIMNVFFDVEAFKLAVYPKGFMMNENLDLARLAIYNCEIDVF